MGRGKKLVYGIGINDANYSVNKVDKTTGKMVRCPFYSTWANMLKRCYSPKYQENRHGYRDCVVCEEWVRFSNFKTWMEKQPWKGNHLDKDLLVRGNLIYSPETCIFISPRVNSFLLESDSSRGEYPIGVSWNKNAKLFMAYCRNVFSNKREFLGYFKDANIAHQAWLSKKRELANKLAAEQDDERVSIALIERYKSYNK